MEKNIETIGNTMIYEAFQKELNKTNFDGLSYDDIQEAIKMIIISHFKTIQVLTKQGLFKYKVTVENFDETDN